MTGHRILVLNTGAGSISFIDPNGPALDGAVAVGDDPRDLVEARGHGTVFVSLAGSGSVARLEIASRQIVSRTETGKGPGHIYQHPSGEEIWVVSQPHITQGIVALDRESRIFEIAFMRRRVAICMTALGHKQTF